jgi:YD repeat-containing protein
VGADSTRGWLWSYKKYDWKGRVTRIINTDGADGSTLNDSDQLFSYEGCGCAGGEVVTVEGESVPVPGQSYSARRKQKIYSDILGRQYKTEIYNWNGTTVYTTTVNKFNGRDQITQTTQYAGTENINNTNQSVTMTYDGHGRMKTRHYPIEDSQTETSWIYNADDSIQQVIDPRGAITSFTYNNRGLTEEISYAPPANYPPANSPSYMQIPDTPTVKYAYDAVGNRISMKDGLGPTGLNDPSVTYEYNELSQLTAENRFFADSLSDAPVISNNQVFRIEYTYNLAGGLKSVKDPFGDQINYAHDKIGRLTAIGGTSFGIGSSNATTEYADGIQYRAFGGIKQMTYQTNDEATVSMQYDNRLRVSQYEVNSSVAENNLLKKSTFSYLADGKPQSMTDVVHSDFNRTYQYDHLGRLTHNQFGTPQSTPYTQTITYDAFSHMTARTSTYWGDGAQFYATYTNDREATAGVSGTTFDAAGNMIYSGTRGDNQYQTTTFDAANRRTHFVATSKRRTGRYSYINVYHHQLYDYDGDGRLIKKRQQVNSQIEPTQTKYQIWSSVLGSYLTEVGYSGRKEKTNVFAGSVVIAEQMRRPGVNNSVVDEVAWIHADPVSGSTSRVNKDGTLWYRTEYEPLGNQEISPFGNEEDFPEPPNYLDGEAMSNASDPQWMCGAQRAMGRHAFWGAPRHCQLAVLANGGFEDNRIREVIKIHVPFADSPIKRWATPTSKPQPWAEGGLSVLAPASIPSADGIAGKPTHDGGHVGNVDININDYWDTEELSAEFASDDRVIYGKKIVVARELMPFVAAAVTQFLDKNPKCEQFINSLLAQLAKDKGVTLEGDIRFFVKEFGKKGILKVTPVTTTNPKNIWYGTEGETDPSNGYGTPTWGFWMTKTDAYGPYTANVNASTFLHELIHSIRGGVFSDSAAADAVYKMGLMNISPEDYLKLPDRVKKAEENKNSGNNNQQAIISPYWGEVLKYMCGATKVQPAHMNK